MLLVRQSKYLPKQHRILLLALVASQRLKVNPYCWRHHTLRIQGLDDSSGVWHESPLLVVYDTLWSSFQGARNHYTNWKGKEAISTLTSCTTNKVQLSAWQDSRRGAVSGTHVLVVTNSYLTKLNRWEITSSTRNLANLQGLVKLWAILLDKHNSLLNPYTHT